MEDEPIVIRSLRQETPEGPVPRSAGPAPPQPRRAARLSLPTFRQPGPRNMYFFCIGLRSCIVSGVPIVRAFHLMSESQHHPPLRKACGEISHDLEVGVPLDKALRARGGVFSPFFVQLLMAGHRSGGLVRSLDLLTDHYLWVWEVRTAMIKTFVYPIFLLFGGAAIMAGRDVIIQGLQGGLASGDGLEIAGRYLLLPCFGAACAFLLSRVVKSQPVRPLTDEVAVKIPVVRKYYRQKSLAIFFRMLATSVEAGSEINAGFASAVEGMDNHALARKLRRAEKYLYDGQSFYEALTFTGVLNREALGMVRAGEEGGSLPALARRLAGYYMTETRTMVVGWAKALYPLMMCVVAISYFFNVYFLSFGAFLMFFLIFMTV